MVQFSLAQLEQAQSGGPWLLVQHSFTLLILSHSGRAGTDDKHSSEPAVVILSWLAQVLRTRTPVCFFLAPAWLMGGGYLHPF